MRANRKTRVPHPVHNIQKISMKIWINIYNLCMHKKPYILIFWRCNFYKYYVLLLPYYLPFKSLVALVSHPFVFGTDNRPLYILGIHTWNWKQWRQNTTQHSTYKMTSIRMFICTLVPYKTHNLVDSSSKMQLTLFTSILLFLHLKRILLEYTVMIFHTKDMVT